jgi:hypothetical protein
MVQEMQSVLNQIIEFAREVSPVIYTMFLMVFALAGASAKSRVIRLIIIFSLAGIAFVLTLFVTEIDVDFFLNLVSVFIASALAVALLGDWVTKVPGTFPIATGVIAAFVLMSVFASDLLKGVQIPPMLDSAIPHLLEKLQIVLINLAPDLVGAYIIFVLTHPEWIYEHLNNTTKTFNTHEHRHVRDTFKRSGAFQKIIDRTHGYSDDNTNWDIVIEVNGVSEYDINQKMAVIQQVLNCFDDERTLVVHCKRHVYGYSVAKLKQPKKIPVKSKMI